MSIQHVVERSGDRYAKTRVYVAPPRRPSDATKGRCLGIAEHCGVSDKAGKGITEGGFNKAWRKARIAGGCPGRIPHDFRRTAVRNLVRASVPERVAMQLTGHKTRAVFERYNIVSAGDLREAAPAAAGLI